MGNWFLGIVMLAVLLTAGWVFAQPAPPPAQPAIVVAEGEQFKVQDNKGWKVTGQDDSFASHTYGGMWVSNGGLLGAPADSVDSVATTTVTIPEGGLYKVWSKYQSPPYFSFMHRIDVIQNGKTVLSRVYGKIDATRQYSFGAGPTTQLFWIWGVDHDAAESSEPIELQPGPAEIRLITVQNAKPAGDPMVDFVLLTNDLTGKYAAGSSPFTVDALMAGHLYLRYQNTTATPARLTFRVGGHMQPDYGGRSAQFPAADAEAVAPGQWSPWFNVAPTCRLAHDEGAWLSIPNAATFPVQVARDVAGKDIVGDMTVQNGEAIVIPVDITWNKERKVRTSRECAQEITKLCKTWRTANGGKKPKEILYYGAFNGPMWVAEMKDALGYNTVFDKDEWKGNQYEHNPIDGYFQHIFDANAIRTFADKLGDKRANFRVLSFGDEISVPDVNYNDPNLQPLFTQWLAARRVTAADLGFDPAQAKLADQKNPHVAWYAKQFSDEHGISQFRAMTQVAKEALGPQVETGANYSPHGMPQYYGPINQWIDMFKYNGMSMFWAEDYIFSVPQPPQIISWMFAIMHCATKYNHQRIHYYVMPHAPGQTPENLRRSMVYSIGAGARDIDNFWVAPAETFTENSVGWGYPDMFKVLHESIYDSAEAEPYQLTGRLRANRVAIVLSRATDYNERKVPADCEKDPFLAMCPNAAGQKPAQNICHVDQQLLYMALKHAQVGVDLITEEDILDNQLLNYDTVYFAGEWVNHNVVPKLEEWVRNGGTLYATAGLGHKNEFNENYNGMLNLLGLRGCTTEQNLWLVYPYLELPLAQPIDTITLNGGTIPAIGMKQALQPNDAQVIGQWEDGQAAVTVRQLGRGRAIAVGTLAGTSFYKTGLRVTPWARGGRKMVYNPTDFDPKAQELALLGIAGKRDSRPVVCSNTNVEAMVMDSAKGTLVTLVNWDNKPLPGLKVSVKLAATPQFVRTVQGQKNLQDVTFEGNTLTFTTDLEWADYILLPK